MQKRFALTVWILLLFVYCLPGISVGQINKSDLQELENNIKSYVGLKVEGINRQLTQMDRRFGAVESRLNAIDNRLTQIDQRFNQIDQRFNTLDGRIDTVSKTLTGRIDTVFTWIAGLIIITVGAFAIMLRQQHRLDKQVGQIDLRLTHVENRLDGIDKRLGGIDNRLTHVENRLDSIDSKLDKLLEQSSSRIITS